MMFSTLPTETSRRAKQLYRKLLWSYIGIATTVLGLSATALYCFVAQSLHYQHKEELKVLAEVAAPSLKVAQTQSEFFDPNYVEEHWHQLEQHSQSVEWFDSKGKLIVREGKVFPALQLPEVSDLSPEGSVERDRQQDLYVATLPVFESDRVSGIVRVSESLRIIQTPLTKLRWGLVLGSILVLGAIVLSGVWFARLALQPFLQSYQRLREFTADASHELRTPLAIVQAGLDVMLDKPERFGEADHKTLVNMDLATHQLRQLTEALLQLARRDRISQQPQQDIPLQELLEDLIGALEAIADEHGVQIIFEPKSELTVRGNNSQLVQLFTNLLQNGIQYNHSGGKVTVTLSQSGKQAIVTVADTGIGIAPEDIPYVFERFWRADKARSQQQGGLGLGLAISSDIVKQHHGKILLHSQLNRGTTFEVRLPVVS